jgi:hypothetical protein
VDSLETNAPWLSRTSSPHPLSFPLLWFPFSFPYWTKKELSISVCLFHNRNLLRCRLREQREAASVVDAPPLFSSNNFLRCKVVGACANCCPPSQPHQQQRRKNCPFSLRNCALRASSERERDRERRPTGGGTSSHPPAHKGWMISGHDSSFLLGFVPNLTMVVTSVAFLPTYLPTYLPTTCKLVVSRLLAGR